MTIFPGMFCVSEAEAAAIRAAYEQGGELSAAVELRRLFPGITDNAKATDEIMMLYRYLFDTNLTSGQPTGA